MKAGRAVALAAVGSLASIAPAGAATLDFSGTIGARAGYGTNPFLVPGVTDGSILGGVTIAPQLIRSTAVSATVLSGQYDRDIYATRYDPSDSLTVDLRHRQQINAQLIGNAHVGFQSSVSSPIGSEFDPTVTDALTIGRRSRRLTGDAGFDWQPNARDSYTGAITATRATYAGRTASNYDQYGANLSFLRAINARTSVGARVNASRTNSRGASDSTAYQPSLSLQQVLSAAWTFRGSIGAIFQRTSEAGLSDSSISIGFQGSLCGRYPRYSVCLDASRQTAPSGIGGLRTDLQIGFQFDYTFSEASRLNASASYIDSKARSTVPAPDQRFIQAQLDYQHDLTQRLSVGIGERYQSRTFQGQSQARSISVNINARWRFGRLR